MTRAGIRIVGVPYRSGGESVTAVLSQAEAEGRLKISLCEDGTALIGWEFHKPTKLRKSPSPVLFRLALHGRRIRVLQFFILSQSGEGPER
jgi:hypothetical protein